MWVSVYSFAPAPTINRGRLENLMTLSPSSPTAYTSSCLPSTKFNVIIFNYYNTMTTYAIHWTMQKTLITLPFLHFLFFMELIIILFLFVCFLWMYHKICLKIFPQLPKFSEYLDRADTPPTSSSLNSLCWRISFLPCSQFFLFLELL